MRNKYPGNCCICNKYVPAGEGFFERINRKKMYLGGSKQRWFVRCTDCVGKDAPWKCFKKKVMSDE